MLASVAAAATAAAKERPSARSSTRAAVCGGCPRGRTRRPDALAIAGARVAVLPRPRSLPSFLEAQEAERRRIARDLHDVVGQTLAVARLGLLAARERLGPGVAGDGGDRADDAIGDAISAVDEALRSVRTFAIDLRPAILDDLGLEAALRWVVARTADDSGLATRLELRDPLVGLPDDVETTCFRIVQEALLNVVRHARATRVTVRVGFADGDLEVAIRDDGLGFDAVEIEARARTGNHLGLVSMHERALAVGGCAEVRSAPGIGAEVLASLPVGPMPSAAAG